MMVTPKAITTFLLALCPFILGCQQTLSIDNSISVLDEDFLDEDLLFPSLKTHQSMAFYGDYAVFVTPEGRTLKCDLFSIKSGSQVASITLPYAEYKIPHANVACFGRFFYANNSILPVLYVSSWNQGRQAFVYDISKAGDDYSASLVQIIDPRNLNGDIVGEGYMDWVVDAEGDCLYSISYHLKGTSTQADGNYTHVTKYKLPGFMDKVIYLEDTEILDSFQVPVMTVFQDKAYYNNHIYIVAGMPSEKEMYPPRLFDIDLDNKTLVECLLPVIGEPEGFCVYSGIKWLNMFGSTTVYNLDNLLHNF